MTNFNPDRIRRGVNAKAALPPAPSNYAPAIAFLQEEIDENLLAEVAYAKLHQTPAEVVACQQQLNSFFAAIALLQAAMQS